MKLIREVTIVINDTERVTGPRPWNTAGGSPIANLFQDPNVASVEITLVSGGGVKYMRETVT